MKESAIYDLAMNVATEAHRGQVQKGESGLSYIEHPIWVAKQLGAAGYSIRTQAVGLLHDVPEDTKVTRQDLLSLGFEEDEVVNPVMLLTKNSNLGYFQNTVRAGRHPRSRAAKWFDNIHNMDLARLGRTPTTKEIQRTVKYTKSLAYLSTLGFQIV